MSDAFYTEMQGVADELITEFEQGTVQIVRTTPSVADPSRPWDATYSDTPSSVLAVVKAVRTQFVVGTRVIERAVQIVMPGSVTPEPLPKDKYIVDGRSRITYKFERIPEAGIPVAFKVWVSD